MCVLVLLVLVLVIVVVPLLVVHRDSGCGYSKIVGSSFPFKFAFVPSSVCKTTELGDGILTLRLLVEMIVIIVLLALSSSFHATVMCTPIILYTANHVAVLATGSNAWNTVRTGRLSPSIRQIRRAVSCRIIQCTCRYYSGNQTGNPSVRGAEKIGALESIYNNRAINTLRKRKLSAIIKYPPVLMQYQLCTYSKSL